MMIKPENTRPKYTCAVIVAVLFACVAHAADPVVAMLENPRTYRQAMKSLSDSKQQVSDEVLRAVVRSLRFETLVRDPWPPAMMTPASALLIRKGSEAVPFLVEGLHSDDANVRRHSAYVLGKIINDHVVREIESGILREARRLAGRRSGESATEIAPLHSMTSVYLLLRGTDAIDWLFLQAQSAKPEVRDVITREVRAFLRDPVDCSGISSEVCARRQYDWWEKNRPKRFEEVVRSESLKY